MYVMYVCSLNRALSRARGERGPASASEPVLERAEPTQLAEPKVQNKPKAKTEMCIKI